NANVGVIRMRLGRHQMSPPPSYHWRLASAADDLGHPLSRARVSRARRTHYVGLTAARRAGEESQVLNRYDHRSAPGEAEIRYLDGDFRAVRPGAFVRCAVTGVAIPLEELKYWSVERQEPYASPEAVLHRLYPGRAK